MEYNLNPEECDVANYTTLPFLKHRARKSAEKWGFDRGWWHSRRPQHMYQVLHFPECGEMIVDPHYKKPIDIISCPKNCSSSIKQIWAGIVFKNAHVESNTHVDVREKAYTKNNVTADQPWREQSIRIAIKRDPVERAFSAATHILYYRYNLKDPSIEDYERFFFGINHTLRYDPHVIPQSKFYGNDINFYDEVYDVKDFKTLATNIENTYSYNPNNKHEQQPIQEVKKMVGMYASISLDSLPQRCIDRIKWLYRMDYEYGWC